MLSKSLVSLHPAPVGQHSVLPEVPDTPQKTFYQPSQDQQLHQTNLLTWPLTEPVEAKHSQSLALVPARGRNLAKLVNFSQGTNRLRHAEIW